MFPKTNELRGSDFGLYNDLSNNRLRLSLQYLPINCESLGWNHIGSYSRDYLPDSM